MIIEKTVLVDKWLLVNADDKSSWKYLFLIDGKLHSLSEAEELHKQFCNQPDRLNPEDTIPKVDWINFKGQKTMDCICDSQNCENK